MDEFKCEIVILLSKRDKEIEKMCKSYGMIESYPIIINNLLIGRKLRIRLVLTVENSVALLKELFEGQLINNSIYSLKITLKRTRENGWLHINYNISIIICFIDAHYKRGGIKWMIF